MEDKMQREHIVQKLKEKGCRITKQRLVILDIILSGGCASCKEIYYKASELDGKIGTATVYRMINTLEEIGAIDRKNMYKVSYKDEMQPDAACVIELDDRTERCLSAKRWNDVVRAGMRACGYIDRQNIVSILVNQ